MLRARRALLASLALLACAAFLVSLTSRSLWSPDEGRYAEIAREMLVSGDWVTPRLDYVRYFEKPPLVYWATAASFAVCGVNEVAARLPVALCGLALLALTAWLGEMMASRRAGLMAAVLLATCPMVFAMSQFLVLDMPLAALVTAALAVSWRGFVAHRKGEDGWRRWPIGAAALLALATLTKGPIAVVLAGMVLGPALLARGAPPVREVPWGRMLLVYLAITVPWFALIGRAHPEFLTFFFVHEHLDRYLKTEHARPGHAWYFLPVLLGGFFPWSCLVPALWHARPRLAEGAARWLGCWIVLPVAFFSLSQSKLPSYVLPVFPALAVWLAAGLEPLLDQEAPGPARELLEVGGALVALVALAAIQQAWVLDPSRNPDLLEIRAPAIAILSVCAAAGLAGAVAFARGRVRTGLELFLALALVGLSATAAVSRVYEPQKDSRVLAGELRKVRQPGEKVAIYGNLEANSALPFYLGEPVYVTGWFWGELTMAHDAPQGDEADRFRDAVAVQKWMLPDAPRAWFLTECAVYDDYFVKQPFLKPRVVRRHGTRVLFTNR